MQWRIVLRSTSGSVLVRYARCVAKGNGLTVQEAGVFRLGFEGMTDRVAEVEDAAEAAFFFVGANDFTLDADAFADDRFDECGALAQNIGRL